MNLNQLEYFIALAETLNFTKAAEQLEVKLFHQLIYYAIFVITLRP